MKPTPSTATRSAGLVARAAAWCGRMWHMWRWRISVALVVMRSANPPMKKSQSTRVSDERPVIHVLMALTRLSEPSRPTDMKVVDLMDIHRFLRFGYRVVAIDPVDHAAFMEWRKRHPEATSDAG